MTDTALQKPPESILLIRLTARGDVVFSSPIIRALRRTYPDTRISWLGEAHTKDLIEHHPELHRVFSWEREKWKRLLKRGRLPSLAREVRDLLAPLRAERFDVAIDLQGLFRSGLMSFLSGAPARIVLRPKEGSQFFATHVLDRHRDQGSRWEISSEYRFLAEALGLETDGFRMEVPLHRDDRTFATDVIQDHGLENGYAIAIPFTTRPQKHWFEERWSVLADRLESEMGLPTVILGGSTDEAADGRIREGASSDPVSLVGRTSLREAAAMIEGAALVVGVDTGLTHVGIAFDRPTIGIYGSNIPYTETFTSRTRLLIHWLDCVPCKGHPTCDGDFTCLRLISVDEVLGAARELLGRGDDGHHHDDDGMSGP
jgi:heptosyltransferase-1